VHAEEDNLVRTPDNGVITDYYRWYWANESELIFFVSTPGAIESDTARVQLVGHTYDNTDPDDSLGYMDLYVNGDWAEKTFCDRSYCSYNTTSLLDGLNEIRITLWRDMYAPPYFDYLDLLYTSRLVPSNNALDITLDSLVGLAQIEVIDAFLFKPVVLDIADPLHPAMLIGYDTADGLITFQTELENNSPNRFYVATLEQALAPFSIELASPPDLRTASEQIDLFIVTPREFANTMDEYVDYRQTDGISIAVVTVEDIMDNFAYGLYDPTAIRDFLKFAYENYPSPIPSAVLLVGDGTYDFLDHLGEGVRNHVPPYIHSYDESASDDNYVYFGEYGILDSDTSFDTSYVPHDRGYDMLVARWPVRNVGEINTIISKTKAYESPSNFGLWRTDITLVADDEFGAFNNETFHVTQTEELEKKHIPPLFHRKKIYLWEYPFVNLRKPAVNDAIVNSINKGTLLFNFVGHGNPDVLAHELVFTRTGDLPRLDNFNRLPLVFTASCAIGFFDDPKRESMGEDLLVHATGGAIGVVSATRLVYASENAQFNRKVFDVLFYNDSLSIGEAVYAAKLLRQYDSRPDPRPEENDRAYLFFGDPYVKLGIPKLDIRFDFIPADLTALKQTRVTGQVVDSENLPYANDGRLLINVYDSERQKTYRVMDANGNVIQEIDYTVTGPTIYRGSATITSDGSFDFEFIPPLDIGYGGQGAKIVVYAVFDTIDAAGLIDSLTVSDSVVTLADSAGPAVIYAFPQRGNFVNGDLVSTNDVLEITASDPSGINLAGGLGHGITLIIDDQSENTINLTDRFEYNQDDFTTGKVTYSLQSLSAGRHTFKIKVWDNANNSTTVEFAAEVMADEKPAIVNLLNYPNPMKDSTRFSLELTQPVRSFTLEIFTLSGRKIKSFGPHQPSPGYYDDIMWYGRDAKGDRVATGVYIYKATAVTLNGGDEIESFGKVVVIN
ncbi:MAG: type IX secretion system sortase PorU, partial [Candidatus Zixiibacteriota bacterium]